MLKSNLNHWGFVRSNNHCEKIKQLTLLQRQKPTVGKDENSTVSQVAENQPDIVEKMVLKSLSMLKPGQLERTKTFLIIIYEALDVGVNEDGFLSVDDRLTTIEATIFVYILQQRKKGLHDPNYKCISQKIDISPSLVANSDAMKILQPTRSKTVHLKSKRQGKRQRNNDWMTAKCGRFSSRRDLIASVGNSDSEKIKLEKLDKKGPAAYGTVANLQSQLLVSLKVETFLQIKTSDTKYRQYRRRFPRLIVIPYDLIYRFSV